MLFLVDEQLPPALARWIVDNGHMARHVNEIGLAGAGDQMIWAEAARSNAVIVTKDEDFLHMSRRASGGPQVVWINMGNTRRRPLLDRIANMFPQLVVALEAGERIVELRG